MIYDFPKLANTCLCSFRHPILMSRRWFWTRTMPATSWSQEKFVSYLTSLNPAYFDVMSVGTVFGAFLQTPLFIDCDRVGAMVSRTTATTPTTGAPTASAPTAAGSPAHKAIVLVRAVASWRWRRWSCRGWNYRSLVHRTSNLALSSS